MSESGMKVTKKVKELMKKEAYKGKVLNDIVNKLFSIIDLDNSDSIEIDEFGIFLNKLSELIEIEPPTEKEIKKEFNKLDVNKDNHISKKEFTVFVKKLISMVIDTL